jgi:dimethlysulfoniopropionate lyase
MDSSLRDGAHRLWRTLESAAPESAALASFLADWPATPPPPIRSTPLEETAESRESAGQPLPVLRWLPRIAADAERFGADFVTLLCGSAASLRWRQTYTLAQVGRRFLDNYGWTELVTPGAGTGALQISCGVLVLGPNTFYPPHRHEAEEIYLPLAGTAEWQQGEDAASWRRRPPGILIHHSSEEPHAMRTGEQPLLAMYLWRSEDLRQGARLDRRSGE